MFICGNCNFTRCVNDDTEFVLLGLFGYNLSGVTLKTEKKRPFLFKLIIFSLLLIAIMGWLRVFQSVYQWDYLLRYQVSPDPWYCLITGILMGIIASIGVVMGWFRLRWNELVIQAAVVVLSLGWWLDYIIFSQSSIAFYNVPFRLVANLIYLLFVVSYFYLVKGKKPKGKIDEE